MNQFTDAGAAPDWISVSPDEAGFADDLEARLDKAVADKRVWNIHSVIVVRNGRLVLERYFDGVDNARGRPLGMVSFKPDTLHDLRSVSKSIVGLLYGIALAAGKVPSPDTPLFQSFPEYADLAADPARSRWSVHHVLSMTLGTDWDELSIPYTNPENSEIAMDRADDRYRYILDRPVVLEPGQRWIYNGGATALLGYLIERGTGQSLQDYARSALFDLLGIGPTDWFTGRDGRFIAASGIRMAPRDLARIGQLMLSGGVCQGRAVVPPEWIVRCTSPVVPVDEIRSYGYHWYMGLWSVARPSAPRWNRIQLERFWSAVGNGGQRLFMFPGLDLVVATTSGNYDGAEQWVPPTRVVNEVVFAALL